jgi:hypothetical protein
MTAIKTQHLEDALTSVIEKLRNASTGSERRLIQIDLMMLLAETYAYESYPLPPEATSSSDNISMFTSEESLESELSPDTEAVDSTTKNESIQLTHESAELRFDSPLPSDLFSKEQRQSKKLFVDDDDIIETQMARLLQRVRRVDVGEDNQRNDADVTESIIGLTSENGAPFVLKDQSYLEAKPKHEQNKTVVEEQIRLFRSVAKNAARKQLEEHSRKKWKNIVLFTSGLTIASPLGGLWFYGVLFGARQTSFWCGSACSLLFIISVIRLVQALTQLNQSFVEKCDSFEKTLVKYSVPRQLLKRICDGRIGQCTSRILAAGARLLRRFMQRGQKLSCRVYCLLLMRWQSFTR